MPDSHSPSLAGAVLSSTRPRQWLKNVLVVAAPLAAGALFEDGNALAVLGAFIAFTLTSAAVYLLNDVLDVTEDRRHPIKARRPVASGDLSRRSALVAAAVLLAAGVVGGAVVDGWLAAVLVIYVGLQVTYAVWLKHMAVIDLAVVSSGFLLRAVAGGVATDLPLSQWFLLVASFGSLFMVAGKRYSELSTLGTEAGTRKSLTIYSESYLRFVWSLAAAVTITAYSLWAFEIAPDSDPPWQAVSIAPFVLGLLRYAVDIDRGLAGEPEDIVLRDRVLQALAVVWLVTFALGVAQAQG